jgi:hypothetical protein
MWRVEVTIAGEAACIAYAMGAGTAFAMGEAAVAASPETVADLILNALPEVAPTADDPDYVSWFVTLMKIVDAIAQLPIAYSDYFDGSGGWKIGEDSGIRYPHPPALPEA